MTKLKEQFTDIWNIMSRQGKFSDVDIEIAAGRTDVVERVQVFLEENSVQYDTKADIKLKRRQPHDQKPTPHVIKYIVYAKDVPEEILSLLHDMNMYTSEHEKKKLFLSIIEYPEDIDDIDWERVNITPQEDGSQGPGSSRLPPPEAGSPG